MYWTGVKKSACDSEEFWLFHFRHDLALQFLKNYSFPQALPRFVILPNTITSNSNKTTVHQRVQLYGAKETNNPSQSSKTLLTVDWPFPNCVCFTNKPQGQGRWEGPSSASLQNEFLLKVKQHYWSKQRVTPYVKKKQLAVTFLSLTYTLAHRPTLIKNRSDRIPGSPCKINDNLAIK